MQVTSSALRICQGCDGIVDALLEDARRNSPFGGRHGRLFAEGHTAGGRYRKGIMTALPVPPAPPPPSALSKEAYTPWSKRLLAFLIDWAPIYIFLVVQALALTAAVNTADDTGCIDDYYGRASGYCSAATPEWLVIALRWASLPLAVYFFWNFCNRQGRTGQSIGKSVLKFKVVSEKTGRPIGFWRSFLRELLHYLDQLACCLGYLWPLWDDKRQTFADKIMRTVCVPLGHSPRPTYPDNSSK
jgi:uncharacterized RDD family membrane protein YckC